MSIAKVMKNIYHLASVNLRHSAWAKLGRNRQASPSLKYIPETNMSIYRQVAEFTMTSPERVSALIDGVRYIVENNIDGAFVECGVWRGGSAMAIALTLQSMGVYDRDIYLFDTFTGMTLPSDHDISSNGDIALDIFNAQRIDSLTSNWCLATVDEVSCNMETTGYPVEHIAIHKGPVEETLPHLLPDSVALLRLDTDWYQSTKHELNCAYPRLTKNGILLVDDYGFWKGSKRALDEYIAENELTLYLHRIDDTGRITIKT